MAGAATDSSRMGLTLKNYDQVIALSQANINETLRRHFAALDAKDELLKFEAEADPSPIEAEVRNPIIELVDKDNADSALYIIRLGEGTYSTATRVGKKFQSLDLPTDGWELAFDIDFAFVPVEDIPEDIRRQVPLPGGYSVHQLIINFGDITRILQLDMTRTKYTIPDNMKNKVKATSVESGLELFIRTYLKDKLLVRDGHNVLGFAVKIDQAPTDRPPTFLPTASKVQIVGHRADGNVQTFRQDNPYNAFCFTEMTDKRTMPSTELKYSGNFFYGSIGGTLAMSRTLFWDPFMVGKVKAAHVKAVEVSNMILDTISSSYFEGKAWCLDNSKPSNSDICGSTAVTHWNKTATEFLNFWSKPRCTVHTLAKPNARKGELVIQQEIELNWEEGGELSRWFLLHALTALARAAFNASIKTSLKLTLYTTISFKAVSSTGDLQVDSNTETTRKEYKELEIRIGGIGDWAPEELHTLINECSEALSDNYKDAKKQMADEIKKLDSMFSDVASGLKRELNDQKSFVFPGDGTFDMKDPLFNDQGDLLVGLTCR